MLSDVDTINLRTMRSSNVVAGYARQSGLLAHEIAAVESVAEQCRGVPILDIGVGGGRTVRALLKLSDDYLGIDNSRAMVAACRKRFPWIRFADADARRLDNVADNSIGLAMFSCNGISMVGHDDRLQILRQVARVLRPGGVFLFSTYNRNSPQATAGFRWPEFEPSANPLRLGVRALRFLGDSVLSLRNRLRYRRHEQHTSDYAIINDVCHNHSVMLYYISLARQRAQLEAMGFEANAAAFDAAGHPVTQNTRLDSFAFVARKRAA